MARYVVSQLGRFLLLMVAVAVVTFALVSLSPVDPLQANVGQAALMSMSEEKRAALAAYWGADTPMLERFLAWAGDLLHGDLGMSLRYNAPVAEVIASRAANSLALMGVAWVASGVLGFVLGVAAALREGRLLDRFVRGYCFVLAASPTFWVGLLLLIVFSVWLGWFPLGFSVPVGVAAADVTFADALHHMALPAITLSVVGVANVALHTLGQGHRCAEQRLRPLRPGPRPHAARGAHPPRPAQSGAPGHHAPVLPDRRDLRRLGARGRGVQLSRPRPGRRHGRPRGRRGPCSPASHLCRRRSCSRGTWPRTSSTAWWIPVCARCVGRRRSLMTDAVFANQPPVLSAPRRLRLPNRRRAFALALGGALLLAAVVVAGLMAGPAAQATDFAAKSLPPSLSHPFGTDWMGRDMLLRTLAGLSTSVLVGLMAAVASSLIALALAAAAALGPRWADHAVSWLIDLMMGIPHIVLLILISYALGKGFWGVTIGVALTHWPSLARILRAEILQCASSDFVAAAARLGAGRLAISARHMVPYVLPQFVVGLVLLFPHAILHEAAITFLGFGLPPEMPAIGIILSEAMGYLSAGLWWLAVFPGLALVVCVMLFDVVGTSLRKLVDPAYAQE